MRDQAKYYYGRLCDKHPEERGLRNVSRRMCVKCAYEAARRSVLKAKKEKQCLNPLEKQ